MKKIFLIFLLVAGVISPFFIPLGRGHGDPANKLKLLSAEERKCLDLFFRESFAFDGLGYTLFGDKPMTAVGCYNSTFKRFDVDEFINSPLNCFCAESLRKCRGLEIFQKHLDHFSGENFGFVLCKNFIDNDYSIALFVNKKVFLETVKNNLADFKRVLGVVTTPKSLLSRILSSDDVFGEVLKNHQGLIGTLLGYGRNNAWLFQQREEINPCVLKRRFTLRRSDVYPSPDAIDCLNRSLQSFDGRGILDFNPLLLSLPTFSADPNSEETKRLKVNYERQYRQIVSHYRQGDFLETTIAQMLYPKF